MLEDSNQKEDFDETEQEAQNVQLSAQGWNIIIHQINHRGCPVKQDSQNLKEIPHAFKVFFAEIFKLDNLVDHKVQFDDKTDKLSHPVILILDP